jgi:RHS repeat-associated protein
MGGHTPQRFRRIISLAVGALFLLSLIGVIPGSFRPLSAAAAATYPPVTVYVAYADSLRANSFFPNPWQGSSNVVFEGCTGPCTFDAGAIRIDNPTSSSLTIQQATVDVGAGCTFALWPSNLSLPPGQTLILTQEGSGASSGCSQGNLFDTSDAPSISCTADGIIPVVHITINGITTSYNDTRQVLNTGGFDLASCPSGTNESHQWQIVGGGPTVNELRGGGSPSIRHQPVCQRGRFPVNCATGEFWHMFNDLRIPGRGIALDFTRTYSSLGASQLGPLGFGWTHSYNLRLTVDSQSHNVTVNEETGSQIIFTPTPSGFQAPSRVIAALVQNSDGSYTFTRWDGEQLLFNTSGQPVQESDPNGYKTTLSYNAGALAKVIDTAGRSLSLAYTAGGLITRVTDSTGRQVSFAYDSSGNLVSATDVNGGVTTFTYDANHLLLTMTDPNSGTVTNAYDSLGRVLSQADPMNRTTTYSYTSTGTTTTDANGNVTVEIYQNNELTSLTAGSGTAAAATWTYAYDPNTLGLTSVTDPIGHTTSCTYDANGNLRRSVDALNRTTTYSYNGLNDVTLLTDPLGFTSTFTYDSAGNLLSVATPLAGSSQTQSTTFSYGDSSHPGDVTALTDPNGKTWVFAYDANGDLASASDPLGNRGTIAFDTIGRPTSLISPKGNVSGGNPSAFTTNYAYDAAGDVTSVTDPLGHATVSTYDGDGNLISATDPNGRKSSYGFDRDNELTKVTQADGTTLSNGYDSNGNQTTQVNGLGYATTYGYDALDRLTSSTDPLKRTTAYAYDGAGNLTKVTDPSGQIASLAYDAANELTTVTYSDGKTPNVTYAYDAAGRRTSMTDGTGTSTYNFDSLNRLTQSKNGAGQTVGYGYDLGGNPTSLTYPNGQIVSRGFDAAGRLTSVADWLGHSSTFSYDANGNPVTETYPNTTQAAYTYDAADQLTSITNSKGATSFASFSYSRDANGQLLKDTPAGLNQPVQSYSYDQVNRVTGFNNSSYGYDAADNLTKLVSGASLSYDAANELTGMTRSGVTTSFTYDSRGNRLTGLSPEGTAATYTYDQANRLTGFQTTPPPAGGLIKGGDFFSVAARSDGTAWAWGYNVFGQLGNGATANSTVPVQVSGLVGVTAVGAGVYNGLALKSDGTVWAWGSNGYGQLGNATTTNSDIPVQVNNLGGATAIAAGNYHGLAVRQDGTAVAWGDNAAGELGNGATVNSSTPVAVSGLSSVTAVAAGGMPTTPGHSLALKSDGTVWAWGYNKAGQLGNGSTANSAVPLQVNGLSGVTAISANGNNSVALKSDGTVWAWGDNSAGQLGNSSAGRSSTTPVQVNISGVSSISNGADFGLAVKSDGTAWGWGDDASGQLGDGGACGRSCVTPTQVGLTGVAAVSGGYTHSLGITNGGTSYAWGDNSQGELGNGTTTSSSKPVQANNFGTVHRAPASASYAYDGDGLRASKTVAGVTSQFAWNVSGSEPMVLNDGSASYIYGPGGAAVEEITASGAPLYIHRDQLGSTRLVSDPSGNVMTSYQYDPYGGLTAVGGIPSTPLGFAGYYMDAESGLSYLVTRYYDATTGQFLSVDPAVGVTRSPYGYVDGNPLSRRDPTGLWGGWDTLLGGAIGAVVGGAVGAASYGISVASGQQQFSWRRFAGATVGGAVGGAVAGACIGTTWVLLAACGGLGGAAGQFTTDLINGDPPKADNYIWAIGAGAVGGVVGGKLFKLVGRRPWKFSNTWNPGKNAQRLYGQNLVGAGIAFGSTLFRGLLPRPYKSNPGQARSNQRWFGVASPARRGTVAATC